MLDMKTVVFSYFITNTLITLFITLLWYQNRKRYAGLAFWLIDFILQAVGFLLLLLRDVAPDLVSIIIAQMLIAAGALCIYIGLERFVGKPSSQTHNYLLIGGFVGLMTYFTFVQPDISIRTILVSAITILLTGQSSWLLLRRAAPSLRSITRDVGVVFLLYALVAFVRIVELAQIPLPATSDLFEAPSLQVVFVLINQLLCIALTFTLILMVTRRLELDVQTQDIERRRAEQGVKESQERFALAFRSSPYAITITRASDGRMLEVNEGFANITGYSAAECIGKTTLELNLWVDEQERAFLVSELLKGNPIAGKELRFRKKDGALITGLFSAGIITLGDQTCVLSSINDITERKQAEDARRESDERFRTVANFTHDWEYWVGTDGKHIYVSPSCERITGYRAEEFMQDPGLLRQIIHPDDHALINSHLLDGFEHSQNASLDFRIITRAGEERWINHVCVPVYGDDGHWLGRRASNRDITERKRAQREIEHLASFPRLNPNPVLEFDTTGAITFASPAAHEFAAQHQVPVAAFLPRDLDAILQALAQKQNDAFQREITIDGNIFEENIYLFPEMGVARIYTIDITERKRAEEALRESEQRHRDLFEQLPIGVSLLDRNRKMIYANPALAKILDTSREDLLQGKFQTRRYIRPDGTPMPPEELASVRAFREQRPIRGIEVGVITESDETIWTSVSAAPSPIADQGVVVATIDITERMRAEEALRESEERFRVIFEQAAVGVAQVNSITGRYLQINQKHCDILGYTREEMLRKTFQDITHPDDLQPDLDKMRLLLEGKIPSFAMEKRFIRKDGTIVWVNLTVSPMWQPGEAPSYHIAVIEDITARKHAEAALKEYSERLEQMVEARTRELRGAQDQLLQQERLTMLGKIAGGIGHELRSPLGAIKNAVYLLNQSLLTPDPDIQETMQILNRQVDASDRIITSLLDLARPQPPFRRETDLREPIGAALSQVTIPESVTVCRQFDDALPALLVDPAQLQIVFHNLIRNAVQAMPNGGQLTIATRASDDEASIAFSDTGGGIAPEDLAKIFQPLFSTKSRGLGIGLALCKLLVDGHHGRIKVTSQVGAGTTFVVSLPRSGQAQDLPLPEVWNE